MAIVTVPTRRIDISIKEDFGFNIVNINWEINSIPLSENDNKLKHKNSSKNNEGDENLYEF